MPVENLSNHLSLHFSLKFPNSHSLGSNQCSGAGYCSLNHFQSQSVNWSKVTQDDVNAYCNHLLSIIPEFPADVFNCSHPDCSAHLHELDCYCLEPFNCVKAAADLYLPKYCNHHRTSPLSGWNISAQSLKESAYFWHKVWSDCSCPTLSVLFHIKKNNKRRFKYEVRRLRRRQCYIRRKNLAAALSHSKPQKFWKQVKRISNSFYVYC